MAAQAAITADDELAIACLLLERKPEGLFRLLEALAPKVKRILQSKLGNVLTEADIDDVLLVSAQKTFQAAERFDDRKGHLSGWFYRIAYRTAIDRFRRLGGKPTTESLDDHDEPHDVPAGDENAIDDSTRRDLVACVEALGPLQRKIIEADLLAGAPVDAEGLSKKLGIPKQNVYSYREKAHRALEKCMTKRGHTDESIRSVK